MPSDSTGHKPAEVVVVKDLVAHRQAWERFAAGALTHLASPNLRYTHEQAADYCAQVADALVVEWCKRWGDEVQR